MLKINNAKVFCIAHVMWAAIMCILTNAMWGMLTQNIFFYVSNGFNFKIKIEIFVVLLTGLITLYNIWPLKIWKYEMLWAEELTWKFIADWELLVIVSVFFVGDNS